MKKYYPIPLHMHSVWERNASMEGHFYNAKKLGIRHMYITDHDVRMGRRHNHISSFDFSKQTLKIIEPSPDPLRPRWHGFVVQQQDDGTEVTFDETSLVLKTKSTSNSWSTVSLCFDSSQKRHEWALLASVYLHLTMQMSEVNEDMRIVVDVELSQRPPAFLHGHILYVFGNTDELESPYASVIKMNPDSINYTFDLLKDAASVGGGDNVLRTVTFSVSSKNNKEAFLSLSSLAFSWEKDYEDGRILQQELADEIGKKYDVTPFVTSEITAAGPHKICFSTKVPIINYEIHNYKITDQEAMNHVLRYGGIFSRNHPFENIKDAYMHCDNDMQKEELIEKVIQQFIQNRAWNAAMIEVGFPEGREGISLASHLKLWDALSKEGILISGYGDSDNHTNNTSWFEGNNFVGYIAAEIPDEEHFVESMLKGDLYTGDPVYLQKMHVSFESDKGQPMGSISNLTAPGNAVLRLTNVPANSVVTWTLNGSTVKTENILSDQYEGRIPVPTDLKVNFVRAAVYNKDRCILLTNPIYHSQDFKILAINDERRFNNV